MLTRQIVTSAEGLTTQWLSQVLRARVNHVDLEPVSGGLMARTTRATLGYEDGEVGPASVVVKYPTDDEGSLGLALAMGMYELEVRFYRDVAPLLTNMSIPRCYLAELESSTGAFTLVLEDLCGSRPGDVLTRCSADECSAVLAELVAFQAPLWNSPATAALDWLADPRRTLGVFDALPLGLDPFIERFGHGLDSAHVELFQRVLPRAGEWVRSWTPPTVVQHGDFRSDNIMFGTTPSASPVTVIDFQTIRLGPPGLDPAYFLGSSVPTEERRVIEADLIREYHERLVAAGVEAFDFDACWQSYREGALYGVFLFVGMASQVESTERGDLVIIDQIRRYADMAVDLDAASAAGLA
ncbi:protein of unknown function DUF227 [Mycolicibacterium rhodesiae JS60]|nr:protein of unknown function DUF227 [Mycolicibacterium rhodesiae JS60]